jgi:hypothetical protein
VAEKEAGGRDEEAIDLLARRFYEKWYFSIR